MGNFINKIYNFVSDIRVALIVVIIFFIIYFVIAGIEGTIGKNFIHFGPNKEEKDKQNNSLTFLGVQTDTWKKVIILYIFSFLIALLETYYKMSVVNKINKYLKYSDSKKINFTKNWTYIIILINPIIELCFYVSNFFILATFQLQFILPHFLGKYASYLFFSLYNLGYKKFILA